MVFRLVFIVLRADIEKTVSLPKSYKKIENKKEKKN